MNWNFWACMYWGFWAVSFAFWETFAGLSHGRYPMLTQVICRYVPRLVVMGIMTWGWWHFFSRLYLKPGYVLWLKGLRSSPN